MERRLKRVPSLMLYKAIRAAGRLGVRRSLNRMLTRYAPPKLVRTLKQRATRVKVEHGGFSLVPSAPLEAKYYEALELLIRRRGADTIGDYLEFGVFNGASLAAMYRALQRFQLDHVRLFGFDSFEGLPDAAKYDDNGYWTVGSCNSDLEFTQECLTKWGIDWNRVHLIKGWFSDTLTPDLITRFNLRKTSIIMVDCDLYTSAKEALTFAAPLIGDEVVIFFDDMEEHLIRDNLGEQRAFTEFLAEHPHFEVEDLGSYGNSSRIFGLSRRQPLASAAHQDDASNAVAPSAAAHHRDGATT